MPLYEYMCNICDDKVELLEFGEEIERKHICSKCGGSMDRIVSPCRFKLEYNNKTDLCDWQGNSSQYWNDYRKAKSEGKDVKPLGED